MVIGVDTVAAGKAILRLTLSFLLLDHLLALVEVDVTDVSVLRCSNLLAHVTIVVLLTVDLSKVIYGLTGAESWQCAHAAP